MNSQPQQPESGDAVLGKGQIAAAGSAVLGGLDGIKQRLSQGTPEQQIIALQQTAINYGEAEIKVLIAALAHESLEMRYIAYQLLKNSSAKNARRALENVLPLFEFESATINGDLSITRHKGYAEYFIEDLGNDVILEMVSIPGGTFMMGTPESELYRDGSERPKSLMTDFMGEYIVTQDQWRAIDALPQHQVTVPSFFMSKYPVTQDQWRAIDALPEVNRDLKFNPSHFQGDNHPVEKVDWYDAVEFCDRLSQRTGREYRLSSEAEWEYACRARTTTPFHFGETITTDLANYQGIDTKDGSGSYGRGPKGEYRVKTTPVDHFTLANAFGLFDMHGNVWEWCQDHRHDSYEGAPTDGSAWLTDNENTNRVIRGGSWLNDPRNCRVIRGGSWLNSPWFCRSASRGFNSTNSTSFNIGFRVVCRAPRT
jgi:formylglycine-generating enzyme required for sulfatase activity